MDELKKEIAKYFESLKTLNSKYPGCIKSDGNNMQVDVSKFRANIVTNIISNKNLSDNAKRKLLSKIER